MENSANSLTSEAVSLQATLPTLRRCSRGAFSTNSPGRESQGDLLSHVADMALFLAGPIRRVVANRETFVKRRPSAASLAQSAAPVAHSAAVTSGPLQDVTNEDYVGALVQFANGAQGCLEVCRVIQGHKCDWSFEVEGTQGAVSWNFERMNELNIFCPDGNAAHDGYTRIVSGPSHPFHAQFNPAAGTGLGYDDLKTIEAYQFLKSIAEKRQGKPGFAEALRCGEGFGSDRAQLGDGKLAERRKRRFVVIAGFDDSRASHNFLKGFNTCRSQNVLDTLW